MLLSIVGTKTLLLVEWQLRLQRSICEQQLLRTFSCAMNSTLHLRHRDPCCGSIQIAWTHLSTEPLPDDARINNYLFADLGTIILPVFFSSSRLDAWRQTTIQARSPEEGSCPLGLAHLLSVSRRGKIQGQSRNRTYEIAPSLLLKKYFFFYFISIHFTYSAIEHF